MQPTLQARIEAANKTGRLARIPFLTAGFPDKASFLKNLKALADNGADVIEIGVPFSDPVADGPVVEAASRKALENGVTLGWIMESLKTLQEPLQTGLVLMGYYNPFLQYGFEKLAKEAAEVGVQGLIVPDLPLGEDAGLRYDLAAQNLDLIPLVGPNTSEARMKEYAKVATGYVYVVSVMGTTGVRKDLPTQAAATIERAQKAFRLPVALGFGIKTPDQVKNMPVQPQAAVFGSALLQHLENGGTPAEFMQPWLV